MARRIFFLRSTLRSVAGQFPDESYDGGGDRPDDDVEGDKEDAHRNYGQQHKRFLAFPLMRCDDAEIQFAQLHDVLPLRGEGGSPDYNEDYVPHGRLVCFIAQVKLTIIIKFVKTKTLKICTAIPKIVSSAQITRRFTTL